MRIGVVKEIKPAERRVALTDAGARALTTDGHDVLVESGAGPGAGITDEDYERAGAKIVGAADAWAAELVVKVKEPVAAEYDRLREETVLFTYLHLAADRPLTEALLRNRVTAIAYETVVDDRGELPLLKPMSEVAGRLAAHAAGQYLMHPSGGPGLLLGGSPGVAPAKVTVLGGGVVGTQAALLAVGMRADVTILDTSPHRVRELEEQFGTSAAGPALRGWAGDLGAPGLRRRHRSRAGPGGGGSPVAHPGRPAPAQARGSAHRRRHRPGRLLRDVATHHLRGADLPGGRHHPLLRGEHAGRRTAHLDPGADQRDAALRPSSRRSRRGRGVRPRSRACDAASTPGPGRSPTRPWPRRSADPPASTPPPKESSDDPDPAHREPRPHRWSPCRVG